MEKPRNKTFDKMMDKWLWADEEYREKHNPFLEYMSKAGRDLPEVEQVKKESHE